MASILLLEPDRLLAKTYVEALQTYGHSVSVCHTAQSAIACADKLQPDVVILELQLVSHSGIEFLYEFRSYIDWQDIPVLILTTVPPAEFSGSQTILRDELNIRDYLYKPQTSLQKLLQTISGLSVAAIEA
jgi:DNA-binding response OmpR family regulator